MATRSQACLQRLSLRQAQQLKRCFLVAREAALEQEVALFAVNAAQASIEGLSFVRSAECRPIPKATRSISFQGVVLQSRYLRQVGGVPLVL